MKKIFVSLAALVMSASAFTMNAGIVGNVSFEIPGQTKVDEEENIYTVTNLETTLTITFEGYDENSDYKPYLMVATGSGFAVEPTIEEISPDGKGQVFWHLTKESWGQPYMGTFTATYMVCFLDEDMDFYFDEDGEPVFYQAVYMAENTYPAELISVYPNNDWAEETFADAYANGEIRYNLTNQLNLDENGEVIGEISYEFSNGDESKLVEIEVGVNAFGGWNPMDGCYTLSILYALDGVASNEISEIEIYLYPLNSDFGTVKIAPVVLENDNSNMRRGAKKASVGDALASDNEKVTVYSVSGVLVKENVSQSELSSLPKGLYIANGKKIVVK